MMMGWVQPGTRRGTFWQMIGSRKMTPPRMLRMVPLGDFHICLRLNSFTRASSGVMVAHLTPTPCFLMALAASIVTWSSVCVAVFDREIVVVQVDVEIGVDQLLLDEVPDDAGHLVAVEFDDRVWTLIFAMGKAFCCAAESRAGGYSRGLRGGNSDGEGGDGLKCGAAGPSLASGRR